MERRRRGEESVLDINVLMNFIELRKCLFVEGGSSIIESVL